MSSLGGGYLVGKTFLIDRLRLIAELEALSRGDSFSLEQRRRALHNP